MGYAIGAIVLGAVMIVSFIYSASSWRPPQRRQIAQRVGLLTLAVFPTVNAITSSRSRWINIAVVAWTVGVVAISALWDRRRRSRVARDAVSPQKGLR